MSISITQLKEIGAISSAYNPISLKVLKNVSITQLMSRSKKRRNSFNGIVTVDSPKWVASVDKDKDCCVYSANNDEIGAWDAVNRTFFKVELIDNRLVTKQLINLKEAKNMADISLKDVSLENALMEDLTEVMAAFPEESLADFGQVEDSLAGIDKQPSKKDIEIDSIRQRVDGITIANNEDVIVNNQRYGRSLGFVTKQDPVIKFSVKQTAKVNAQGKKVIVPNAEAEVVVKYNETGKVNSKYVVKENSLAFSHAKPTKPIAMVISTPAGSDISLTKIASDNQIQASEDTTRVTKLMSMEAAYAYMAFNYDGSIREDDSILGKKATWLRLRYKINEAKVSATGEEQPTMQATIVLDKTENRTTLLTEGNFFPMKLYKTISQQDLSPENAGILNLNIEAALKKDGRYTGLSDEAKAQIERTEDGTGYTSVWFNKGEAIKVYRYDNKEQELADVRIPVRDKKATKSGDGFSYSYEFYKIDDKVNGPLSKKNYRDFITLTGMSDEEFIKTITKFSNRVTSKKSTNSLTAADYLKARASNKVNVADGSRSFAELQKELNESLAC